MKKLVDIVFWQARRVKWNTTHEKATAWKLINFSTFFSLYRQLSCTHTRSRVWKDDENYIAVRGSEEAQRGTTCEFWFFRQWKRKKKKIRREMNLRIYVFSLSINILKPFSCVFIVSPSFILFFFAGRLVATLFFYSVVGLCQSQQALCSARFFFRCCLLTLENRFHPRVFAELFVVFLCF